MSFAGSATTGVVATALGRRFIGLDLSREYLTDQARRRLERPHAAPIRPAREEYFPLFDGAAPC
jgi:DNA modification methylase